MFFLAAGCVSVDDSLQQKCSSPSGLNYDCVVREALARDKPEYCFRLGGDLDDPCMQDYFEQKNDSSVCALIPKEGVKQNCAAYYRGRSAS